jgi:hypothetical protein
MASSIARAVLVALVLAAPLPASGQGRPPNLSKEQRQALLAAVTAVKQATPQPPSNDGWQIHVLRASDGSHYVAFSVEAPPDITTDTPLTLYIRLTPRLPNYSHAVTSRSAVEEWLLGQRSDPLPMRARRVAVDPDGRDAGWGRHQHPRRLWPGIGRPRPGRTTARARPGRARAGRARAKGRTEGRAAQTFLRRL